MDNYTFKNLSFRSIVSYLFNNKVSATEARLMVLSTIQDPITKKSVLRNTYNDQIRPRTLIALFEAFHLTKDPHFGTLYYQISKLLYENRGKKKHKTSPTNVFKDWVIVPASETKEG